MVLLFSHKLFALMFDLSPLDDQKELDLASWCVPRPIQWQRPSLQVGLVRQPPNGHSQCDRQAAEVRQLRHAAHLPAQSRPNREPSSQQLQVISLAPTSPLSVELGGTPPIRRHSARPPAGGGASTPRYR